MSSTLPTEKTSSIEAALAAELGATAAVAVTRAGEGAGMARSRVSGAELLGLCALLRLLPAISYLGSVCYCYLRWEKDSVDLC